MRILLACLFVISLGVVPARAATGTTPVERLPSAVEWFDHLNKDIMPFWTMPAALGEPVGDFPTFRCNDGTVFNRDIPCQELAKAPDWIKNHLDKEYLRMKSRQTYVYGVAYHLTGESRYLEWMRAGVNFIRTHGLDRENGGAFTYFKDGKPDDLGLARNAQDLAYAQIGLGFYFYLTRDPEVLKDILTLKDYIFENYRNDDFGLYWTRADTDVNRKELVALLDQINAYMLLLTPILPQDKQVEWKRDLAFLGRHIVQNFHDPETGMFWGAVDKPAYKRAAGHHHNDFGHSIKTYWMLYLMGRLLEDETMTTFAETGATQMFDWAYLRSSGSWASSPNAHDQRDRSKHWWIYAELDQAAATFALSHNEYVPYLANTYRFWLNHMVDPVNKEVWHVLGTPDKERDYPLICTWSSDMLPKVHLWKNGYHVVEHVLIGYVTGQGLRNEPVTLHFAFVKGQEKTASVRPYYYEAEVSGRVVEPLEGIQDLSKVTVTFNNVK